MAGDEVDGEAVLAAEGQEIVEPDWIPGECVQIRCGEDEFVLGEVFGFAAEPAVRYEVAGGWSTDAQGGVDGFDRFDRGSVQLEVLRSTSRGLLLRRNGKSSVRR